MITLSLLSAIIFMMISKLAKGYTFSAIQNSGQATYRTAHQGPIANYFAACPNTTQCVILDQSQSNKQVWLSPSSSSPYLYSN